ncbi:MAG: hypothetical protein RIK87_05250 [Fuerstiella sp.]
MPVRCIAMALLAVSVCHSTSRAADGENPFARWDRTKQPATAATGTSEVAAASRKTSAALEYFSPDVTQRPSPAAGAGTPEVRRERLRVSTSASASADRKSDNAKRTAAAAPTSDKPQKTGSVKSDVRGRVTAAAFSSDANSGGVEQTGADFFSDASTGEGSTNPFAELLEEPAAEAVQTTAVPAPSFADPVSVEAEFADDATTTGPGVEIKAAPAPQDLQLPAALQGPQTPSVTMQWVHHDEFSVGRDCRCDLVIENTGRGIVRNVTAEAVLPPGLQVVSAVPAPVAAEGSASWSFAELQPGDAKVIQLVVVPHQPGDVQMNAFVQFTGATSSAVVVTEPKVAIRLEGPATVEVGQQIGYTVHVTNPGSGKAENVVIQAAIPEGLEHRQGSLLTIEIGTLNPGELRRARLSVTAVKGGDLSLAVRVVADGDLMEQTSQVVAVAEPRLNIGLRGPASGQTGRPTDFELVVVNEGNVDSNNVRAKYKLPDGFEFVRADAGGKYISAERTIEWFVGTLEPNRVRQLGVTLRATQAGETRHQAGVISEHGRMTRAEHTMAVEGSAELHLKVAAAERQLQTGEETVFEIRIENSGTSDAESVGLSCELPPGLELLEVTGPSEFIADNGVIIFRSLKSLEAGDTAVFAVRARCARAGSHKVRARVASESVREPLIAEETATGINR